LQVLRTGSGPSLPATPNNQKTPAQSAKEKSHPCAGALDCMARIARTQCPPHRCDYAFHVRDCGIDVLRIEGEAQIPARPLSINPFANFIAEASTGFTVPARWISAIMQIESAGDEHAISSRGAMGLMQLMPATWVELSVRYELGLDPFDPRDNIMAGTAYVRELRDHFGSTGFVAAYHAGRTRYEQHLTTDQPRPPETITYIAAVMPLIGNEQAEHAAFASDMRSLGSLFVERTDVG
jgi:hypothetical protein